jgi:hypothetical protein
MPNNNLISRSEVDAFIPEEVAAEVIQAVTAESAALTLCRTIPMGSNIRKQPVLQSLPVAYFVNGDTSVSQNMQKNEVGNGRERSCERTHTRKWQEEREEKGEHVFAFSLTHRNCGCRFCPKTCAAASREQPRRAIASVPRLVRAGAFNSNRPSLPLVLPLCDGHKQAKVRLSRAFLASAVYGRKLPKPLSVKPYQQSRGPLKTYRGSGVPLNPGGVGLPETSYTSIQRYESSVTSRLCGHW